MKQAIIGSGGFGREVYHTIKDNNPLQEIVFFADDIYMQDGDLPLSKFNPLEYEVVVAIGDPQLRKRLIDRLPHNTKFFSVIHSSVKFLDTTLGIRIGKGCIICPNVILTTNITIGDHCHLNLASTIGHDTRIGDYFTTAPGVKVSGNCVIGDCVYLGTNAAVRERVTIVDNVTVGLSSGVVKDILQPGVYGGVPTKLIK